MKKIKVIHLTSAHPRYDIRIFYKMCSSLANFGYNVNLIVADGKGYEVKDKVKIFDIGKASSRLERMIKSTVLIYKRALSLNGDIYHIHDPELLPYAYLLKLKGKIVIFDSHEDSPRQILTKPYINKKLLRAISFIYEKIEKFICSKLDYIISATPHIRDIFLRYNKKTIDINNYPILEEITKIGDLSKYVCYIGGLSKVRGYQEMIDSMKYVKNDINLLLAGNFLDRLYLKKSNDIIKGKNIVYKGFLNKGNIKELLQQSFAGLVTLHPTLCYIYSLPTKMFEYMSAGLPVIASNFPLWKEIIEGNKCGICVNPLNPKEIAEAIDYLYEHKEEAIRMGINGKKAIYQKYNWNIEVKKLLKVYEELLLIRQ